ncbi:quaternary amine ABC transporter ATP-binding protein [Hydromonas duriensis]|uniref:Quaternary amine transport ATP-binding protein n=1 Tax=Hydromonas duriensis TaxID=1527608 RepID=A0A4R6Y0W8_9BURK|nr:glycine betaine/L-proline ABC transporter ATP-binding protein [Hydromonas duriensis]TDR27881.1 glycine betaine/proline transport system ATP-binding protein [Hydromonas duriensis]
MSKIKIEVQNITKIFGEKPQEALAKVKAGMGKQELLEQHTHTLGLHNISLNIEEGEIFVIMGLSGSGKSTLIRHFNRLIDPSDGHIIIDGEDVMEMDVKQLEDFRRRKISMVFQSFGLMPHYTVVDNVAYALEVRGVKKAERIAKATEWLETVGLAGYENLYPRQLSGGQQQRVGLARALAADTDVILMDEAFSALDPLIRSQMQEQLLELQNRLQKTIVFITHDLSEALRIGSRIAILKDGELSQIGTPEEILLNPSDDYVREFVKEVNRASVLTVEAIMRKPRLCLENETHQEALTKIEAVGIEWGWVLTNNRYQGMVTRAQLKKAIAENSQETLAQLANNSVVVTQSTTVEGALPSAIGNKYPLPVVDQNGKLWGVVTPDSLTRAIEKETDEVSS